MAVAAAGQREGGGSGGGSLAVAQQVRQLGGGVAEVAAWRLRQLSQYI
jgi:hypothetical protein